MSLATLAPPVLEEGTLHWSQQPPLLPHYSVVTQACKLSSQHFPSALGKSIDPKEPTTRRNKVNKTTRTEALEAACLQEKELNKWEVYSMFIN